MIDHHDLIEDLDAAHAFIAKLQERYDKLHEAATTTEAGWVKAVDDTIRERDTARNFAIHLSEMVTEMRHAHEDYLKHQHITDADLIAEWVGILND